MERKKGKGEKQPDEVTSSSFARPSFTALVHPAGLECQVDLLFLLLLLLLLLLISHAAKHLPSITATNV